MTLQFRISLFIRFYGLYFMVTTIFTVFRLQPPVFRYSNSGDKKTTISHTVTHIRDYDREHLCGDYSIHYSLIWRPLCRTLHAAVCYETRGLSLVLCAVGSCPYSAHIFHTNYRKISMNLIFHLRTIFKKCISANFIIHYLSMLSSWEPTPSNDLKLIKMAVLYICIQIRFLYLVSTL